MTPRLNVLVAGRDRVLVVGVRGPAGPPGPAADPTPESAAALVALLPESAIGLLIERLAAYVAPTPVSAAWPANLWPAQLWPANLWP